MRRVIEDQPVNYPTPKDVFQVAITEMLERGEGSWCYFHDADSSAWAEVAPDEQGMHVKLSCPRVDRLRDVLTVQVMSGCTHWQIVGFRRKGLLSKGGITYLAPQEDLSKVTAFIDNFFIKTCAKGRRYRVLASVQS